MSWPAGDSEEVRLEDVSFSPSGALLAAVDYRNDRIMVFEMEGSRIGPLRFCVRSPQLKSPHAMAFLDDARFVVANRFGSVAVFRLPGIGLAKLGTPAVDHLLAAEAEFPATQIRNPTGIACYPRENGRICVLVANLEGSSISRHILDPRTLEVSSELLLRRGIHVPDAIAVSADRKLIAVSNHGKGEVLLFRNRANLGPNTAAATVLEGLLYPHAVRFSPDDRYILASDAGSPYLFVFANPGDAGPRRVRPLRVTRVISAQDFSQDGNCEEGGVKGIDVFGRCLIVAAASPRLQSLDFDAVLNEKNDPKRAAKHLSELACAARGQKRAQTLRNLRVAGFRPRRWASLLRHSWRSWNRNWPVYPG